MASSSALQINTANIQAAYIAYFGRPADPAGLTFWSTGASTPGTTMLSIMNSFANSAEFNALYGINATTGLPANGPAAFVNAVYQNVFGHSADIGGLTFYTNALTAGTITYGAVVYNIISGATGADQIAANDKVTAATAFTNAVMLDPAAYINYGNADGMGLAKAWLAGVTSDATLATQQAAMPALLAGIDSGASASPGSLMLTTGLDAGSAFSASGGGAVFSAPIIDNHNTFQSGDSLAATGNGNVLNAVIGNSQSFAILATTSGIQTVNVTAEAMAYDSANNNPVLSNYDVQINATQMTGVTNWGDIASRADVTIENIQLPNMAITTNGHLNLPSDVTFTMRNTQPGSVGESTAVVHDFTADNSAGGTATITTHTLRTNPGVNFNAFFDQQSLRVAPTLQTNSVVMAVGNGTPLSSAAFALNPISNPIITTGPNANLIPFGYNGFTLGINSTTTQTFLFTAPDIVAIENATTASGQGAALLKAIQDATDINSSPIGQTLSQLGITAALQGTFTFYDQVGVQRSAPSITLTGPTGTVLTPGIFTLNGTTLGTSGQQNEFIPNPISSIPNLITTNIVLDNVGGGALPQAPSYSGSTEGPSGNVLIGSMATSGGVQQFNVDVQNGSWINSLASTNGTLQVVNIVSDGTLSPTTGQYLFIGQELGAGSQDLVNWATPQEFVGTNGLTNVQVVNATGFTGSLMIGETINSGAIAEYLANTLSAVNFSISLGNNTNGVSVVLPAINASYVNSVTSPTGTYAPVTFNSVNLVIDPTVAASGNFHETITGGTGNDYINLAICTVNPSTNQTGLEQSTGGWLASQTALNNIVVNVGQGDNIVSFQGSGTAAITAGSGNDTFYLDNMGGQAVWVANSQISVLVPTAVVVTPGSELISPAIQSDVVLWAGFNGGGTQTIGGVTVTDTNNTAGVTFTADQVAEVANGGTIGGLTKTVSDGTWIEVAPVPVTSLTSAFDASSKSVTVDTTVGILVGYSVVDTTVPGNIPTGATVASITDGTHLVLSVNPLGVSTTDDLVFGSANSLFQSTTLTNVAGNVVTNGSTTVTMLSTVGVLVGDLVTGVGIPLDATVAAITPTGVTLSVPAAVSATEVLTFTPYVAHELGVGTSSGVAVSSPVFEAVATAGTPGADATAATQTVTWTTISGLNSTETIGNVTVTDTTGALVTAATIAADVALGNGVHGAITVSGLGIDWTATATNPASASDLFTNVTVGTVVDTALTGLVSVPANDTTVNLTDGVYSTNVSGSSIAPHTYQGVNETVTVSYDGVSSTANIHFNAAGAGSYTSADVNNAIVTAINGNAVLNKLINATEASSGASLILHSLVDGAQPTPVITFSSTPLTSAQSTAGNVLTGSAADVASLANQAHLAPASGFYTNGTASGSLVGYDSGYVNNSTIVDAGSTSTGANVIDLGSNPDSLNTVTLSGPGMSYIVNAHSNDVVNFAAASYSLLTTSGIESTSTAVSSVAQNLGTGAGLVEVYSVLGGMELTQVYQTTNLGSVTTSDSTLIASIVGDYSNAHVVHLV